MVASSAGVGSAAANLVRPVEVCRLSLLTLAFERRARGRPDALVLELADEERVRREQGEEKENEEGSDNHHSERPAVPPRAKAVALVTERVRGRLGRREESDARAREGYRGGCGAERGEDGNENEREEHLGRRHRPVDASSEKKPAVGLAPRSRVHRSASRALASLGPAITPRATGGQTGASCRSARRSAPLRRARSQPR